MDLHMFVRDHAHAYIVRPSTLGSPQSLRPSSIMGTIITQQKGLTDIYYLCSPSPLHRVAPSSSQKIGASLLIYLHIYICCKWKIKKENKNKTNNNNNSKQQVVETFCGYFLKTYQNQSANASKRKNNSKKIKKYRQETHRQKYVETFCADPSQK